MRLWLLLCSLLIFPSCAPRSEISLPRAAPAHVHFLQKEAMLTQAPALVAQVSQSERLWLQGASQDRTGIFLRAAPNWLQLDASQVATPVFGLLRPIMERAASGGITGIYLGQTGERPDIWLSRGDSATTNPASLNFAANFGSDEEFARLAAQAEDLGLEMGSSLLPAATGAGPDFFLQARRAPEFAGLYAMLPAPDDISLPAARDEWDFHPLDAGTVAALAARDVLPPALARDAHPWASPGGWAVTGAVTGMDGVPRRWIYRYAGTPAQPVLAWPDPSGNAAKIFAAAIIRGTGLLGQSLVGLHLEPLFALEPGEDSASLSPGLDALNELSRQAHRYGGWTLQADAVPVTVMEQILAGATDFCRDDVTELLALFGFLNADGRPIAALYRHWIGRNLNFSRLARGLNGTGALEPRLLRDKWAAQAENLARISANGDEAAQAVWENFALVWRLGLPGLAFLPNSSSPPEIIRTLKARKELGLPLGRPLAVLRGRGGGLGILTTLPDAGYWLLACNFGIHGDALDLALPGDAREAINVATGENMPLEGRNVHIALDGRVAMNVVFLK